MTEQLQAPQAHLGAPAKVAVTAVAEALTTQADDDPSMGHLVIVARTADGAHRTLGAGAGPLRAAISVAVAADNTRLWSGIDGLETVEMSIRSMPEIVRAAAEAMNIATAHVGCVCDDDPSSLAALAVWFEIDHTVACTADRRATMELLSAAVERQRESRTDDTHDEIVEAPEPASASSDQREFDVDDPSIDSVTGLATRAEFEEAIENYESDEATLVVVELDGFPEVADEFGDAIADQVLREVADRMVSSCRGDDLIARTGADTFAVLVADASRSVGMQVAKRLHDAIATPLAVDSGPADVTATVALAHQSGLVDMEELLESADHAVASGKRAGSGKLVIAS